MLFLAMRVESMRNPHVIIIALSIYLKKIKGKMKCLTIETVFWPKDLISAESRHTLITVISNYSSTDTSPVLGVVCLMTGDRL